MSLATTASNDAGARRATRAVRAGVGSGDWIINGRKIWITKADEADFTILMAVTDKNAEGRNGMSAFLVDRDTPGFRIEREIPMLGGHRTYEVVLEECRVPDSQVLGEPGSGAFEVVEFDSYRIKISDNVRTAVPEVDSSSRPTLQLFGSDDPKDRAELAWRLSLPLCTLLLALLALPLSYYNPRSGHAYNLVFALGAYLAYQNLLWLLRNWIASDKLPSALAILPAHLLILLLALALLHYRNRPAGSLLPVLRAWLRKTP